MVTGYPGPCVGNIIAIPRLGFGGLCLQDGPLAIRVVDYASVFAAGVSSAATFDRQLMYDRGAAMGAEFRGKGSHVALGYVFTFFSQTTSNLIDLSLAHWEDPHMLVGIGRAFRRTLI